MSTTRRMPAEQWKAVTEAAFASHRADCGHAIDPNHTPIIWLRTQKVGAVEEVWSVCFDCHVDADDPDRDYTYRRDIPGHRPYRERTEYL